ncbi:PQQ-dependent sugar dehydrogenase [Nocardioides seonyuensis]|nr:PQQ-dependent sugar dehydrogenase [Nocardioides seonyuensis]
MSTRPRAPLAVTLLATMALAACGSDEPEPEIPRVTQPTTSADDPTPSAPTGSSDAAGRPRVQGTVAEGLSVPWGIDFLDDGTALVTERDTRRVLAISTDGQVSQVGLIDEAAPDGEGGLLGLAVGPDRDVFLYVTTEDDNRVLRTRFAGGGLGPAEVILDGIPQGVTHDGGRLAFGPDGYLYVSTGEAGNPDIAQDPESLGGKILRITTDGRPAPGNPDPGSPVWTSGHRNVQGLAWDDRGRMWASEFGAQTRDELNLVEKGNNYGWPRVEGAGGAPEFTDPHLVWPVEEASPSGLAHLDGHLYMAGLRGERLWRIDVTGKEARDPTSFFSGEYGRLRPVVAAPDGSLWVATSNQDGRGDPRPGDDRILRVTVQ